MTGWGGWGAADSWGGLEAAACFFKSKSPSWFSILEKKKKKKNVKLEFGEKNAIGVSE